MGVSSDSQIHIVERSGSRRFSVQLQMPFRHTPAGTLINGHRKHVTKIQLIGILIPLENPSLQRVSGGFKLEQLEREVT